ncbi:helix-turn-helix domain-containing protein [Magnetofaba australis]
MGSIGEKIRPMREALGLGRAEFAERIGVNRDAVRDIEVGRRRPTEELMEGIGREWPQFAYWLMTGKVDPEHGHISPEIELERQNSPEPRTGTDSH